MSREGDLRWGTGNIGERPLASVRRQDERRGRDWRTSEDDHTNDGIGDTAP
jgi:hypothetical protein